MKKLFTLLTLLLCVASSAWADEENISLVSYTVENGKATLSSTSGNVTVVLSRNNGQNADNPDSKSRGFRWQTTRVVTVNVASGKKINSVKLTSGKNGNSLSSIVYTLTDGTNSISGSWDYAFTAGKQDAYTWTATDGTFYNSWVLTNTGTSGDIYISGVTVNYETASVTNTAPTIVTQPKSMDAYVGFETTLTVGATGYPTPTYQWYANSNASNVGGTAISGATNATYTFTPTTTGKFYYYVVASNTFDSAVHTATSNVATVTVGTKYSVNFDAGSSGATVSIPPAEVFYPGGTVITLPTNHYFYLDGNSVGKWSDGENEYDLGAAYTVNSNVTFYPVFATNTKTLGSEATTITWTFSRDDGAPQYAIEGDGKTTTVIGTTENGIDLAADVALSVNPDNSNQYGKFNNSSYTNRAQVNAYTSFTIPAVKGMTVTYVGTNGAAALTDAVTFDGEPATSVAGSTYTYEYTGENPILTIADLQGGRYPSGITVQYPYTGIPEPAVPENMILLATISNETGTLSNNTWTMTDNNNYTFSATSLTWKSNTTDFKINKGGTYTIKVPSDVKVTRIDINGYSSNTTQGTTITLGDESHLYTTAEVFSFTPSHSAGADIEFTTSNDKEMEISYIKLYAANGLTLTTTASMQGWRAFYDASSDYTLDANTKAYVATKVEAQGESDVVVLDELGDAVPAGMAVLLKTTNQVTTSTDGHYSMTLTKASNVPMPDIINQLKRAADAINNKVYRLGANDAGVGFFAYTKEASKPDVVVLDVDSSSAGARSLTIAFADDETTGIGLIDNGKLTTDNEAGAWYSIQGVRHDGKPSRSGLYIFNGKKVVIK